MTRVPFVKYLKWHWCVATTIWYMAPQGPWMDLCQTRPAKRWNSITRMTASCGCRGSLVAVEPWELGKLPVGAGHIFSRSLALCLKDQQMKRCSLGWVQGTPILEKSLTCSRKVMKKQKKGNYWIFIRDPIFPDVCFCDVFRGLTPSHLFNIVVAVGSGKISSQPGAPLQLLLGMMAVLLRYVDPQGKNICCILPLLFFPPAYCTSI